MENLTTPMNGMDPESFMPGPITRRLCICTFQCPLCFKDHETEIYISCTAADLDEYHAQLRTLRKDWQSMKPAFANTAVLLHQERGDLARLMKRAVRNGFTVTEREPTIELTGETAYTCDNCSRTFDSMNILRTHTAAACR